VSEGSRQVSGSHGANLGNAHQTSPTQTQVGPVLLRHHLDESQAVVHALETTLQDKERQHVAEVDELASTGEHQKSEIRQRDVVLPPRRRMGHWWAHQRGVGILEAKGITQSV
jgi:hypothetical protein